MLQTTLSSLKKTSKERKRLVKSLNEELSRPEPRSTHNPAVISEYMKDITYIRQLADSNNPAELNEALMALGLPMIGSRNPTVIDEQRRLLYSYLMPKIVSGNPITIKILGNLTPEITGLKVTMNPIQDLHGYDNPWVGGAGKNKLNMVDVLPSGNYTGNTFNCSSFSNRPTVTLFSEPTSIIFSFKKATFGGSNGRLEFYNGSTLISSKTLTGENQSDTIQNVTAIKFNYSSGGALSVEEPMIRLATVTDTTFAPYENICPISGRTEVNVTRTAGEDVETKIHEYTETIYGGTDDFVNGELSVEWGYIASYDEETLPGEWISDRDTYAPNTTPTIGAEVAYKLSESVSIETTPEEITLLKGENVLSTDGDSIEITYKQNFT